MGEHVEEFAAFYEGHGEAVRRALAVTLLDQELAGDATQEAMARAWRRWSEVRGYINPAGWVFRVGLNWGRSRLRKVAREVLGTTVERGSPAPVPSDPRLRAALAELSWSHRAVVVLRLQLDWSVEQVAAALDIPEGTVRSRQHTALRQLREHLTLEVER